MKATQQIIPIQEQKMVKAKNIIAKGETITQIDNFNYQVPSQSGNWYYRVKWDRIKWSCDCPDHNKRQADCKHILATMVWIGINDNPIEEYKPMKFEPCPKCGSYDAIKYGSLHVKNGKKTRFQCKDCKTTFTLKDNGFEWHTFDSEMISDALNLYFSGMSYRKIAQHFNQKGIKIAHNTIYYWVTNFTKIVSEYVNTLTPEVGGMWSADEIMIKVKEDGLVRGKYNESQWVWMWNVLDNETRFLLASNISKKKNLKDAIAVFRKARDLAQDKPKTLTTDGLHVYNKAFNKVFRTLSQDCKHVSEVALTDKLNNNRVERLHGTVRARDKVMRAMQNPDTSKTLLEGFRTHYNFVRPHMALDGMTPAEKAGINLNLGNNKWKGLIEKAVGIQINLNNSL